MLAHSIAIIIELDGQGPWAPGIRCLLREESQNQVRSLQLKFQVRQAWAYLQEMQPISLRWLFTLQGEVLYARLQECAPSNVQEVSCGVRKSSQIC